MEGMDAHTTQALALSLLLTASVPLLPPGWQIARDPATSKFYFYNTSTGVVQWEPPGPFQVSIGAAAAAAGATGTEGEAGSAASALMPIFRRTGDARAMLAHCKSLMAFEQKGGFAMVEGADWVPSACLTEKEGFVAQNEEQRIEIQEAYLKVPEGIAEDKHAAAEDLMLRLRDVKRLYGRKEVDFKREMAEMAARTSAGCTMSELRWHFFSELPDAENYLTAIGGKDLQFIQFKLGDMQKFAILGSDSGPDCECVIGSMVMCTGTPEDPKLLFSCGYGECIGEGFGGEAVEVEAHIAQALKDAGVEGKLLPFEFLACLLKFALSPKGEDGPFWAIQQLAQNADNESTTTPLLNKACKLIASNG